MSVHKIINLQLEWNHLDQLRVFLLVLFTIQAIKSKNDIHLACHLSCMPKVAICMHGQGLCESPQQSDETSWDGVLVPRAHTEARQACQNHDKDAGRATDGVHYSHTGPVQGHAVQVVAKEPLTRKMEEKAEERRGEGGRVVEGGQQKEI